MTSHKLRPYMGTRKYAKMTELLLDAAETTVTPGPWAGNQREKRVRADAILQGGDSR